MLTYGVHGKTGTGYVRGSHSPPDRYPVSRSPLDGLGSGQPGAVLPGRSLEGATNPSSRRVGPRGSPPTLGHGEEYGGRGVHGEVLWSETRQGHGGVTGGCSHGVVSYGQGGTGRTGREEIGGSCRVGRGGPSGGRGDLPNLGGTRGVLRTPDGSGVVPLLPCT